MRNEKHRRLGPHAVPVPGQARQIDPSLYRRKSCRNIYGTGRAAGLCRLHACEVSQPCVNFFGHFGQVAPRAFNSLGEQFRDVFQVRWIRTFVM
jgi:hypothetical protein